MIEKRGWIDPDDTPPLVEELPKQSNVADVINVLDDEDARKRLINQCDTLAKPEAKEDSDEPGLDLPKMRPCLCAACKRM